MSITSDKTLYDYTRALASGIALADGNLRSVLPKIYLENKQIVGDEAPLIYEGDIPDRLPQAYDSALDRIGSSFNVFRGPDETDDAYRQKIKLSIIQNPTLAGISNSIKTVFSGLGLDVQVFSKNTRTDFFDAVSNNFADPLRGTLGARSYRIIIEISPAFKYSFPKYVDTVNSGDMFYRVKKPGIYTLTLDPNKEFGNFNSVRVITRNSQRPNFLTTVFSSESAESGTKINLGFLSQFQDIKIIVNNDVSVSVYESFLTFNNSEFDFYKNAAYNGLLSAFGVNFLREIFQGTLSFGVIIERINVRQAGSGG
jgi:hypothetical protein